MDNIMPEPLFSMSSTTTLMRSHDGPVRCDRFLNGIGSWYPKSLVRRNDAVHIHGTNPDLYMAGAHIKVTGADLPHWPNVHLDLRSLSVPMPFQSGPCLNMSLTVR
jgi:hypothetical protein